MEKSISSIGISDGRYLLSFWTLCATIFFAGVFARPDAVLVFEQIFIIIYIVLLRAMPSLLSMIREHRVIAGITVLWCVSVTISLLNSPLHVADDPMVIRRYIQTISNVVFFLCVRDFVGRYPVSLKWVLLAIPMACLIVAAVMTIMLFGEDLTLPETSSRWLLHPALNLNIRHTGYLIAAAIGATIGFCFMPSNNMRARAAVILLLTALFTFLFWTGSRGASLSVLFAFAVIWGVAQWKGNSTRFLVVAFVASVISGTILSQLLAVFPWNGLLDMGLRTINSHDLNQLGSGRIEIWKTTWGLIKDHPLFGLGPHGYAFTQDQIIYLHPHSFILQFLLEWGVIGTLLIMTLLVVGFVKGLRTYIINQHHQLSPTTFAVGGILLVLGSHGLYDGTFFYPQPTLYLTLCLAIWNASSQAVPPKLRS